MQISNMLKTPRRWSFVLGTPGNSDVFGAISAASSQQEIHWAPRLRTKLEYCRLIPVLAGTQTRRSPTQLPDGPLNCTTCDSSVYAVTPRNILSRHKARYQIHLLDFISLRTSYRIRIPPHSALLSVTTFVITLSLPSWSLPRFMLNG